MTTTAESDLPSDVPTVDMPYESYDYIDFDGHPKNPSVKLALDDLKFYSKKYKLLGVYKASNFRKK